MQVRIQSYFADDISVGDLCFLDSSAVAVITVPVKYKLSFLVFDERLNDKVEKRST